MEKSEIKIYKTPDGKTSIEVKLEKETVWLSQKQMAELFDKDSDTIGLHLRNIYKSGELEEFSTTEKYSVVRQEGNRRVKRRIKFYNLDAIISVGYRVNSKRGVLFRKWATQLLKDYLIKGYAINQQRLQKQVNQLNELKETIKILGNTLEYKELTNNESKGLLKIISDYSYALELLDQYDYQTLKIENTSGKEVYQLTYEEAIKQIELVKKTYGNSELFGNEKDDSFKSSIATIYQTFGGVDLYPSIEEKAANLLYFIVKNHSFSDGNKRIAAFLFLYFLEKNGLLFSETGEKRIADNALVALTLMIAVSKPDEKETMIKVIVNLINKNN
ncbi:virulence protein RhuM/Fic/DOC family protein [Candidatus Sulfidibacterium hydrothermale]|uniref:RhuM family protein n=1 Tax=Candidatus Sulfidibacterium hydrothermale TaxID=2875962 RepID=UPI001F0A50AC|nr:RhuM family protein [Candidatus Sulfidibacterium hydrothermale]UBM61383.1 virulence protein RhuM/Fic/DOC family protein [Candidatus Sulfidibacterium hydrothermale]